MIGDPEKPTRPKRALPPQEAEGLVLDLDFDELHDDVARVARVKENDDE
jgi:hypothetical protein